MTEGEPEANAAEIAAALAEISRVLGGTWTVEIAEDGQLRLVPVRT